MARRGAEGGLEVVSVGDRGQSDDARLRDDAADRADSDPHAGREPGRVGLGGSGRGSAQGEEQLIVLAAACDQLERVLPQCCAGPFEADRCRQARRLDLPDTFLITPR